MKYFSFWRALLVGALLTGPTPAAWAQAPTPPANDGCATATLLPNGVTTSGNLAGATDDLPGLVGCQNSTVQYPDVWFAFVATGLRLAYDLRPDAPTQGTLALLIYDSVACGGGGHLVAMDCGSGQLTGAHNTLTTGRTYYAAVSGILATNATSFHLTITTGTPVVIGAQDCNQAVIVHNLNSTWQLPSTSGYGLVPNEVTTTNSCFGAQTGANTAERQSKWYKFIAGSTGRLLFNISPVRGSDDYDWAVWDITADFDSCTMKGSALACNWSGITGATGLSLCPSQEPGYTSTTPYGNTTTGQTGSDAPIILQAGRAYALLVDNYTTSNLGFTLNFGGACPDTLHPAARLGYDARFRATGQQSRTVTFTPIAYTSLGATPILRRWTFGDGATSTDERPTHTYAADGLYTVTQQLTDAFGNSSLYSQVLRVGMVNGLAADLATRTALVLAPNPAQGTVHLTLGTAAAGHASVVVADGLGRDVLTLPLGVGQRTADISLQTLHPGVYTVRVGAVARRLVVE